MTSLKRNYGEESDALENRVIDLYLVQKLNECGRPLNFFLGELEKKIIIKALKVCNGNKTNAARLLGLNYTTLVEKVKKLEIRVPKQAFFQDLLCDN